jgi:hypothetical protein
VDASDGKVGQQYGAINFCADSPTAPVSARTACRGLAVGDRAPLLSWVMPYDAEAQTFHLDLAVSVDGLTFSRVKQEGPDPPAVAVPTGKLGTDWNGGLIDAILPPAGVRHGQFSHALLSGVNSGAHFMYGFRTQGMLNATAAEHWAQTQFFGATISQWPGFSELNGWSGIAQLGANMTIEVGYARWRTEGWVSLKAAVVNATVLTKPLRVNRVDLTSCPIVSATANYRGGYGTVELLRANGDALTGYPAASLSGDDVALPLVFGSRRTIPRELIGPDSAGVTFRVRMVEVGSELFGVSFRCTKATLKTDDGSAWEQPSTPVLLFCCRDTNDIMQAATIAAAAATSMVRSVVQRCDVANCAAQAALLPNRSGILLLADDAPGSAVILPSELLSLLSTKFIRIFAEFAVPKRTADAARHAGFVAVDRTPCPVFNRLVASAGSPLWEGVRSKTQTLDVLDPHACKYIPYFASSSGSGAMTSHMVLAKVAGFSSAVFGLNNTAATPVLVTPARHPGLMLSSLPLSAVRRARYSPTASWIGLWCDILRWMLFDEKHNGNMWIDSLTWVPLVGPRYTATEVLPPNATSAAIVSSLQWTHTVSNLLCTKDSLDAAASLGIWTQGLLAGGWPTELVSLGGQYGGAGQSTPGSRGDGRHGIFEAYLSLIQPRSAGAASGSAASTQLLRPIVRSDCVGETAGALAVGQWYDDARAVEVSANLLDYLFFNSSAMSAWPRSDPSSSVGGTLLWGMTVAPEHASTIYADDQSRIGIAAAYAAAVTGERRWDESLMRLFLGNVRLMNAAGYFQTSGVAKFFIQKGWQTFFNDTSHNENNYYQSAGRAMMLLAHALSGDQSGLFFNRTRAGLQGTMAAFHGQDTGAKFSGNKKWVCQVGLTSEAARVLLPLSWLVRLDDTAEHRRWVNQIAAILLERQQPSGAIKEWPFGPNTTVNGSVIHDQCNHHPPLSNAEYGTGESTMSQTGDDPAADLLYSNNFALQSLHEAAQATQDPKLLRAAESLRDFIIRAQVTVRAGRQYQTDAKESLRLEGAWLRSFDFHRWEHYAQASDWQWGPWVAETGHGMSLITMTLAAMDRNTSMWAVLTAGGARMSKLFDTLRPQYII